MLQSIKDINPEKIVSIKDFQDALYLLLNVIENQQQEIGELKKNNSELMDIISRLTGGNARPDLKSSKKEKGLDISSHGKEKGNKDKTYQEDNKREEEPSVDHVIKIEMSVSDLPIDAEFKGYTKYYQQDLSIQRNNKLFLFANYYSVSEGKSYKASLPTEECEGHFGAGVRSLVNILHHYGNVTQSKLLGLLEGFGIQISIGSVSNMLMAEHDWSVKEQKDILQAGLESGGPKQMDCTGNRENGINKVTHIITDPSFSVFYTLDTKSRIDCFRALQGNPGTELKLQWHEGMEILWQTAGVSKPDCTKVMSLLKENEAEVLSINVLEQLLKNQASDIYKKNRIVHILSEAMAFNYYRQQQDYRPLEILLSDDAPEYSKIALYQALCWIHDARYYNKLQPQIGVLKDKLETFKTAYWNFYRLLLDYKNLSYSQQQQQKEKIQKSFDEIFGQPTCYGALDLCIKRTRNNKEKLLKVLDFPAIPLHNNAAELAARRVVRKRDISLHTMTKKGTELRDAFLSIIETTQKLGISAYQYINDRITGAFKMTPIAQLIRIRYPRTF